MGSKGWGPYCKTSKKDIDLSAERYKALISSTAGMSPVVKLSKPKSLPVKRITKSRVALAV